MKNLEDVLLCKFTVYCDYIRVLTVGFWRTITLDAAHSVDNDMQITNLAGRNIKVGRPMVMAKKVKHIDPNNRYIA